MASAIRRENGIHVVRLSEAKKEDGEYYDKVKANGRTVFARRIHN